MILKSLSLQNFRNFLKADFSFDSGLSVIVGPNASGKSNLLEAIYFLATGDSRRTDQDKQCIHLGKELCRIKGVASEELFEDREIPVIARSEERATRQSGRARDCFVVPPRNDKAELEAVISSDSVQGLRKRYLVNGVGKRRVDFAGKLIAVLFTPLDLDIVLGQPSSRRRYLDELLQQVDYEYRAVLTTYSKALRQRNALLEQAQKNGRRNEKQFVYWDELLIKNGQIITSKREDLIDYINKRQKDLFEFLLEYDKSVISEERLLKYKDAELGAGVTLVGPHRDEIKILTYSQKSGANESIKYFASRGQQRLVVLELKISQISYINEKKQLKPLLLLDDIFSELDDAHIEHIFEVIKGQQTVITTTHKEFAASAKISKAHMIELK